MSRLNILDSRPAEACNSQGDQEFTVASDGEHLTAAQFKGTAAVVTLGCAKNQVDSEVMIGVLREHGYQTVANLSLADLIVVNTCGFLQASVEEGIDRILEAAEYKRSGRCRRLIVAGCMVERYRGKLQAEMPEVDRFISTDEILSVADDAQTTAECFLEARRPYFLYDEAMPRVPAADHRMAYVKISEGCSRPCSFCIIPKLRGEFRSRRAESIVSEAKTLLAAGMRELNLVGQDLTAYGSDFVPSSGVKSQLPELLRQLESIECGHDFWIRLLYAYPVGVTDELLELIDGSSRICSYLDLPLQHISGDILKRMRRPLGERGTRSLIEQIRIRAPKAALRTTFIVGFPGETEEHVESLRNFILEGHFLHVGVFEYSQEEEADSFTYPDQVAGEVKAERRALLLEAQQQVLAERLSVQVGTRQRVLTQGQHEESGLLYAGRNEYQAPETDGLVIINDLGDDENQAEASIDALSTGGHFCEVEITDVAGYDLLGRLVRVID